MDNANPQTEAVYHVPAAWLLQDLQPARFDTIDFLLACTDEGLVIFGDEINERWACRKDETRRISPLFERRTYGRHRQSLMLAGLLRKPDRIALAAKKRAELDARINAGAPQPAVDKPKKKGWWNRLID